MYKILNWLFGWDYIYLEDSYGQGISRVKKDAEGNPIYTPNFIFPRIEKIYNPDNVIWLTCSREKYFKKNKNIKR